MEDTKVRKIRFWVAITLSGKMHTAKNKKLLREEIEKFGKENFKGTKIRQLEVSYEDHADLAFKLLGQTPDSLMMFAYTKVISEYDA